MAKNMLGESPSGGKPLWRLILLGAIAIFATNSAAAERARLFALGQPERPNGVWAIVEIDPGSGAELARFPSPVPEPSVLQSIAFDGEVLYLLHDPIVADLTLFRLDPQDGVVIGSATVADQPFPVEGLAAVGGGLYLAQGLFLVEEALPLSGVINKVSRLDPESGEILAEAPMTPSGNVTPGDVPSGRIGSIWNRGTLVGGTRDCKLVTVPCLSSPFEPYELNPNSGVFQPFIHAFIATTGIGRSAAITDADGEVFVAGFSDLGPTFVAIERQSGAVRQLPSAFAYSDLASGPGAALGPPTAVPTFGQFGLVMLALTFSIVGMRVLRRRATRAPRSRA